MLGCQEKFDNENFQFWIKSILATAITKEGLDETVRVGIEKVQKEILATISNNGVCSQCSIEEIIRCKTSHVCIINNKGCNFHNGKVFRKCPNDVCDKFRDEIRKRHQTNRPSWKITKAELWCSNPFEVAKCYLPPLGYDKTTCLTQVDLNGIFSIILNQKDILSEFDEQKCLDARKLTNDVRHSPSLKIEETQMEDNLDVLLEVLECVQDAKSLEAQQKIHQLKNDQLSISSDYLAKVLQDVISESTRESTNRILKVTSKALEELHNLKVESIAKMLEVVQKASDAASCHSSNYTQLKECFKADLITLNKLHHGTIAVSPLFDKTDIPLREVYVIPNILMGEFPQKPYGDSEKLNLLSLKKLFERNGKPCRDIYITSKAGLGKTIFCKRLAVIWCIAHQNEQSDVIEEQNEQSVEQSDVTEEEISKMKEFGLLFFVSLRDVSPRDCEIDSMIQHQIIDYMSRSKKYTSTFLEELLHQESSLIVVDGLDEWTHPDSGISECSKRKAGAPHRKCRENCTFITTSRPWKFREIRLRTSQIDQHLEITGLSKEASDELIKKTIQKHNPKDCEEEKLMEEVAHFNSIINSSSIQELKADPLVLMYLTCLWCENRKHFGHSRCDIYSNLVDLLLERAEKRNSHIKGYENNGEDIQLPECLGQYPHCQKYRKFLVSLGKLAFQKFFTKTREHSLVFGLSTAELGDILTPVETMFVKEAGFLTASKFGRKESKYSFYHKTMQEFFVAIYLQYSQEFDPVLNLMDTVERIISNKKMLVFLSGMNPEVASNLSKELCQKVSMFTDVQGYRCDMGSWNFFLGYNKTMKTYQDMHVACYKEYQDTYGTETKSLYIYQDDIFIDEDFRVEEYSDLLKIIFDVNKSNIKSVKIRDVRTEAEFQERVKMLKQRQISHLEKIDLKCQIYEKDLCELLETSRETLKCFVLKGGKWQDDKWTHRRVAFSKHFFHLIQKMVSLSELYLRTLDISHDQLKGIVNFVSKKENMKKLGLNFITCTDHSDCHADMVLNLARHKHLEMLELGDIPLEKIDINTKSLEVCYVGAFSNRGIMMKIFDVLRSAPKLRVFACGFLKESKDIRDMLFTLVKLQKVHRIWLIGIDLGKHFIPVRTNMENLQALLMIKVKMDTDTFKGIVRLASSVSQTVRVGLFDSEVKTKQDFVNLKKEPDFVERCDVLLDDYVDNEQNEFLFTTRVKSGQKTESSS